MSTTPDPDLLHAMFTQHLQEVQYWQAVSAAVGSELRTALKTTRVRGKVEFRAKTTGSVIGKYYRKPEKYEDLSSFRDLAGARVLVPFTEDIASVAHEIATNPGLEVLFDETKVRAPDKLTYQARHIDVRVDPSLVQEGEPPDFEGRTTYCEIQIQTLAQSLWANMSHLVTYKRDPPSEVLARVGRLVVLCELFDDEANSSRKIALENADDVAVIVDELSKYFFSITGSVIAVESSYPIVGRLLPSILPTQHDYPAILEGFVQQYGDRLHSVLTDRPEARGLPWLLRPEAILIFERITNAPAKLAQTWAAEFPERDLADLKAAWGPTDL